MTECKVCEGKTAGVKMKNGRVLNLCPSCHTVQVGLSPGYWKDRELVIQKLNFLEDRLIDLGLLMGRSRPKRLR